MPVTAKKLSVSVKPISESRTVWLAAATVVVGVLTWFGVLTPEQATTDKIQEIVGTILVVVGAINAVIRMFYTKAPLTTHPDVTPPAA